MSWLFVFAAMAAADVFWAWSLAGQFEYGDVKYDRVQFLTVQDILEEKREFHTPTKMVSKIASAQHSLAL